MGYLQEPPWKDFDRDASRPQFPYYPHVIRTSSSVLEVKPADVFRSVDT